MQLAGALDLGDAALQAHDLLADAPAVDLELRFTGTACPDPAAAEPRQVRPGPRQARQHVLELRQLDLQLAFQAAGAGREDVEDQLAAVEHLGVEPLGERSLLPRAQVLVDEDDAGARRLDRLLQLLDLAFPDVRRGVDVADRLGERRHRLDARGAREPFQLAQRLVRADACAVLSHAIVDADEDGAFRRRRYVTGASRHARAS